MSGEVGSVGIVGGGIAGMSAALSLRERFPELAITLFEAKRSTGGRAGSFVDSTTNDCVDYCQHVAMGCCTNLLAMFEQAGLGDAFTRYPSLTFYHRDRAPVRFAKASFLPAPFHLFPTMLRMSYLSWRQRSEVARATWTLMRSRSESLKSATALQWLTDHHQSMDTIRDYWDVVIASALGESSSRVSMAATRKVFVDGFLAHRHSSDVLVPRLPLAQLFGEHFSEVLERKQIQVRRGSPVQSVTCTTDSKVILRVGDTPYSFDHSVLALPHYSLHKVLDQATAVRAGVAEDRYKNVPSSPITGIHLWFDRPVIDVPHAVFVDCLAQWVFRREVDSPASGSHYLQVVISASHTVRQGDSQQVIDHVVDEIKHMFPNAASAQLVRSRIVTDPHSVFSISPEIEAIRPSSRTALPCLHLAGDFVQTGWPATMEGAVISGRMAASSIAVQWGRKPLEIDAGLPRGLLSRLLVRT